MKNILKLIAVVLTIKVAFFFITPTVTAHNKKPAIEKFVNEFIIHNPNVTYPVQVDAFTTLTGRELLKKGQTIYVQENLSIKVSKKDLNIAPNVLSKQMSLELKKHYCSPDYVKEREHMFKGLSHVGIVNRVHDQNGVYITEVILDRTSCN